MSGQDEAEKLLDDLLVVESGLSAWEMDFLESLDKQRGRQWTDRQLDKLNQIAERVGIGGLPQ